MARSGRLHGCPDDPLTRPRHPAGCTIKAYITELQSPPTVDSLTMEFCDEMRANLTPKQMEQVVSLNKAEPNSNVCRSHDFCDANMVLHAVFKRHGMDVAD